MHLGQNSSGKKLKNYQNSSEKLPKLKQNFSKTQICGYNTRIKRTLTLLERDFATNKTYKRHFCLKLRDFTVREIPGTGREIGTRETGGKLDPGNPGKTGKKIVHFSRVLGGNFENLQENEQKSLENISNIWAAAMFSEGRFNTQFHRPEWCPKQRPESPLLLHELPPTLVVH